MKHYIDITTETINAIAEYAKAQTHYEHARANYDNVASTIKLPSGRTRNGGKVALGIAEGQLEDARRHFNDCQRKKTQLLADDITVYRRNHIVNALGYIESVNNDAITIEITKAALRCFIQKEIQTIKIGAYDFDVNFDCTSDGVGLFINHSGEGRSVCGGLLNVKRKHDQYCFSNQQALLDSIKVNIADDKLEVELQDDYVDGNYCVSISNRDDVHTDLARKYVFILDALCHIARGLNMTMQEYALRQSKYNV